MVVGLHLPFRCCRRCCCCCWIHSDLFDLSSLLLPLRMRLDDRTDDVVEAMDVEMPILQLAIPTRNQIEIVMIPSSSSSYQITVLPNRVFTLSQIFFSLSDTNRDWGCRNYLWWWMLLFIWPILIDRQGKRAEDGCQTSKNHRIGYRCEASTLSRKERVEGQTGKWFI